ncbi:hypothetical protein CERSUDRAFT_119619 [Gelatoporia subvermispora B]|uniref:Protein kinase domain-containing protein n=1 Tax=Ceriporiopsis subvermispora (strain B) TaxID=914234 RepID=M2Q448_CERS8|nr:hypothetical protein CERSUDRAFT_119619 [Gelatoporia subvermispora B]
MKLCCVKTVPRAEAGNNRSQSDRLSGRSRHKENFGSAHGVLPIQRSIRRLSHIVSGSFGKLRKKRRTAASECHDIHGLGSAATRDSARRHRRRCEPHIRHDIKIWTRLLDMLLNAASKHMHHFERALQQAAERISEENRPQLQQLLDKYTVVPFRQFRVCCLDAWRDTFIHSPEAPQEHARVSGTLKVSSRRVAPPDFLGGYADMFRARWNGRMVAVKVVRNHTDVGLAGYKSLYGEAVIWKYMRHPNIAQFYGVRSNGRDLLLVSQLMQHGVITSFLRNNPTENRLKLIADAAKGVSYLHTMGIVHGDLKATNIVINNKRVACVVNFGLATLRYNQGLDIGVLGQGSMRHMAPEFSDPEAFDLPKAAVSTQTDVFAFAVTMWEIFTGRVPFEGTSQAAVILSISRGERPPRPSIEAEDGLCNPIWDLMEICWQAKWQSRPSIDEVIEHIARVMKKHSLTEHGEPERPRV